MLVADQDEWMKLQSVACGHIMTGPQVIVQLKPRVLGNFSVGKKEDD